MDRVRSEHTFIRLERTYARSISMKVRCCPAKARPWTRWSPWEAQCTPGRMPSTLFCLKRRGSCLIRSSGGFPFLGICLGAQLIARARGCRVHPADKKEIGWKSVALTEIGSEDPLFSGIANELMVFQYHEDTFELPGSKQAPRDLHGLQKPDLSSGQCLWGSVSS